MKNLLTFGLLSIIFSLSLLSGSLGAKREAVRGPPGLPGVQGQKGDRGDDGLPGLPGRWGQKGDKGNDGLIGFGPIGQTGPKGEPGVSFKAATRTLLVKHSQSVEIPKCESGHIKLWQGFSLGYVQSYEKVHGQDLGFAGSCIRKFSMKPYIFCNFNNFCYYAGKDDNLYWLSTSAAILALSVGEPNIQQYISRCVVCESQASVIAVHSQSSSLLNCPDGWSSLWSGYSFIMHTSDAVEGTSQSLVSSGSCLKDFRPSPFIECNGARATCHFSINTFSYWLAALESNPPPNETLIFDNVKNRISKCQVCIKNSEEEQ